VSNSDISGVPKSWWFLIGSLYTTQTLALMFFVGAFVAILRRQGASLDQIGMVYMLGMVWPFKFLWAPLVDACSPARSHGHYRSWLLLIQGSMVAVLAVMGQYDPAHHFTVIYLLCLLIAFLSATQDIATDALVCRLLPANAKTNARGLANGLQIAGNLLGTLLGAGVVLMGWNHLGWRGSMGALAAATAITWGQLWALSEPAWPVKAAPIARHFQRMLAFWKMPGRGYWLAILCLYPIGSSIAYALIIPMLVDAAWDMHRIGLVLNVAGSAAGVLSAIAFGYLLRNMHRRTALVSAAMLQLAAIGAIWLLVPGTGAIWPAAAIIATYYLCYNPGTVVLAFLMMQETDAASPATDCAQQFSINQFFALGMIAAGAFIAQRAGYTAALWIATGAGLAALILACRWRMPVQPHVADHKKCNKNSLPRN